MEQPAAAPRRPGRLLAMFTGASLVGFVFSVATMHLAIALGMKPWGARLIAMFVAMNVSFLINGRYTFRALTRDRFLGLWVASMTNSAVGNACNYAVFVILTSSHRPLIGQPDVAFVAGAMTAWAINFLGARFVVFGAAGRRFAARVGALFSRPSRPRVPAPAEHGSSRR
jgi:putative flippase GtrA